MKTVLEIFELKMKFLEEQSKRKNKNNFNRLELHQLCKLDCGQLEAKTKDKKK